MRHYFRRSWILLLGLCIGQLISAQIKVACVGNSITYGYGLSDRTTESYPVKLQELLGSGYAVSNFGVNSRTLLKNGNLPYWSTSEYTQAKNLKPDVVIIMLGTNDAKLETNWIPHRDEFIDDYKAMIKSFRNLSSDPEIWVCEIVPAYKTIWEITDSIIKNEVNPKIKEVALEEGLSLMDMYTFMENKSSLFQSEGIHPTASGAEEMANYIYSVFLGDTLSVQKEGDTLTAPEAAGYQWYFNDQPMSETDSGMARQIIVDSAGSYKVGVQLTTGSQTTIMSDTVIFGQLISAISVQNADKMHVSIYPNPCQNLLTVQLDDITSQSCVFKMYKDDGCLIYSQHITNGDKKTNIDLQPFSGGMYLYQLEIKGNTVESGKVVINP